MPLLVAVTALILSGCNLSSPAEFIKDQLARGTGGGGVGPSADDEDFPGESPDYVMNIYSGGTTLYYYLNGIKNTPGNHVVNLHGGPPHEFLGRIALEGGTAGNVNISLRGTDADTVCLSGYYGGLFMIDDRATLTLRGPTLQGRPSNSDPVVTVKNGGVFFFRSGAITDNGGGGGVYVNGGNFTMSGGTISGNTALYNGGGVYVSSGGRFKKTGGTVTGTDGPNPNTASGNGKAVFVGASSKYRDTTAGPGDTVDTATDMAGQGSGFWQP